MADHGAYSRLHLKQVSDVEDKVNKVSTVGGHIVIRPPDVVEHVQLTPLILQYRGIYTNLQLLILTISETV